MEAHFDGRYKYGEWLPVRAIVTERETDLDAELVAAVKSGTVHTRTPCRHLSPPAAGRSSRSTCNCPHSLWTLTVSLLQGEDEIASREVAVVAIRNITYVAGLIAPSPDPYSLLEGLALDEGLARSKS